MGIYLKDKRKQIILAEIDYWKKHQLLPEHYCNFLSTLYSEGKEEEKIKNKERGYFDKQQRKSQQSLILAIFCFLISVSVLLFLDSEWSLVISGVITALLIGFIVKKIFRNEMISPIVHLLLAVLILLCTLKIWTLYFATIAILLPLLIIMNCLMWIIVGHFFKLIYFTISGVVGIIFTLIFMFI